MLPTSSSCITTAPSTQCSKKSTTGRRSTVDHVQADKVLRNVGIRLSPKEIVDIASAKPESIEIFLLKLKDMLEKRKERLAGPKMQDQSMKSPMKNYNIVVNDEDNAALGKGNSKKPAAPGTPRSLQEAKASSR